MSIEQIPIEVLRDFFIPCLSVQDITRVDDATCNQKFRSNYLAALRHSDLPQLRKTTIGPRCINWVIRREVSLAVLHFSSACDDTVIDSIPHSACRVQKRITVPRFRKASKRSIHNLFSRCASLECIVIFTDEDIWQLLCDFPQLTHVVAPAARAYHDVSLIPITSLRQLTISESGITDAHVVGIAEVCPELRHLNISSCSGISDAALLQLSKYCHALQILHLACCFRITSEGITALAKGCSELEELDLSGLDIGDIALRQLAEKCRKLKKLTLNGCNHISDEGICCIVSFCTDIEYLSLSQLHITDGCLVMIGACSRNLDTIHLSNCNLITSEGVKSLSQCVKLRELYLNSCISILDSALEELSTCCCLETDMETMHLQRLKCIKCEFSRSDLTKLKNKHPDLFLQAV